VAKIGFLLASIAPGLFLIGYNIGTGSITTMASSGAAYGLDLTWPLLLSCIFTYYLIIFFGRYTAVTGKTSLHVFREKYGAPVTIFVMACFIISEVAATMGVMGVVASSVNTWTLELSIFENGIHPVWIALAGNGLLYYLYWTGSYKSFEKLLTVLVTIMGLSFIGTAFMVIPDASILLDALKPTLPATGNAFFLAAGMVGTTMGAILYVVRSITVKEKGWTIKDLHYEKRDAKVSAIVMFVLSFAIMVAAAGTMHPIGLVVNSPMDMVHLLTPLAGTFAVSIFVFGIVAAGLSSIFPHMILIPWLVADYNGKLADTSSTQNRVIVGIVALLGLVVPIFGGRPVFIMILSQVMAAIVAPMAIGMMIWIQWKGSEMGAYRVSNFKFGVVTVIFMFSIVMAASGIYGLLNL
jgi:Mn2+/Fe2+ NRAMP family transporter